MENDIKGGRRKKSIAVSFFILNRGETHAPQKKAKDGAESGTRMGHLVKRKTFAADRREKPANLLQNSIKNRKGTRVQPNTWRESRGKVMKGTKKTNTSCRERRTGGLTTGKESTITYWEGGGEERTERGKRPESYFNGKYNLHCVKRKDRRKKQ